MAILEKDYGNRWLCEAMKKAVVAGKRSMSYVNGILKNWKAEGIDEPWTKEKPPNKGGGRSGKQPIDIIQDHEPAPEISQEEYDELLRLAERMQSGKGDQR
nr:DnaD domain protein [Paenibacillus polymyxa]